jgi:pimeloyl-ACP methyl ester carboxylesterase
MMWHYWPESYMWSYQLVRIIGHSNFGGSNFSECIQAAERITLGDYDSWYTEWTRLGDRVLAQGYEALDQGNVVTARTHFLRASNYIRLGEFFLQPDDPRKMETYLKGIEVFRKGAKLMQNPPEIIQIPYEDSYLPGYFCKGPEAKSPVVVMFGGLDSTAEEIYFALAQSLYDRGLGLIAVDGPGQGAALRLNHIASRYDFDVAGSAVADWAENHPAIDSDRMAIMAWSMGGYMAARIAAFEPRFKACGIYSAVYDYNDMWKNRSDDHPLANILLHVMGVDSMPEAREKLKNYNLRAVAEKITCPTYVLHGEEDQQANVDQAYRVYNALTCEKVLNIVTPDRTGAAHCQSDNLTQAFPLFDWIQQQLNAKLPEQQLVTSK